MVPALVVTDGVVVNIQVRTAPSGLDGGSTEGYVGLIDFDGELKWHESGNEVVVLDTSRQPVQGTPSCLGGPVEPVRALDAATGDELWSSPGIAKCTGRGGFDDDYTLNPTDGSVILLSELREQQRAASRWVEHGPFDGDDQVDIVMHAGGVQRWTQALPENAGFVWNGGPFIVANARMDGSVATGVIGEAGSPMRYLRLETETGEIASEVAPGYGCDVVHYDDDATVGLLDCEGDGQPMWFVALVDIPVS